MADDKIGTHYEGCEQYHLECAKHALADRDRRIEALTKALHQMCKIADFMPDDVAELLHAEARKALASAAGAEGEA